MTVPSVSCALLAYCRTFNRLIPGDNRSSRIAALAASVRTVFGARKPGVERYALLL
jgi:hypothetical protein